MTQFHMHIQIVKLNDMNLKNLRLKVEIFSLKFPPFPHINRMTLSKNDDTESSTNTKECDHNVEGRGVLHPPPPPPPRIIQVVVFRQKSKQVIFWQNHLIFRQALEKTLGHESTRPQPPPPPPQMKQVLCAYEIMKCDKYQPGWILIHREGRRRHVDHIRPLLSNTVTQGNLEEQSKM